MAKRRASGSGFWSGVMLGVAIGVTAALLFGPQNTAEGEAAHGLAKRNPPRELLGRLRDRYQEARLLGGEVYQRAKDEVLTSYARAKSGQ